MLTVYPDYYKSFKCTADKCKHNCCIGWEIDIDPDTAQYYKCLPGEIGKKIRENISWEKTPYFKLGTSDRCPMLNSDGLCEIMLQLGEDSVCDICAEHPRFYNIFDDRTECGLGLCCEEVARMILSNKDTVKLNIYTVSPQENQILYKRDRAIFELQNRNLTISDRINNLLDLFCMHDNVISLCDWINTLFKLERLDNSWTKTLLLLQDKYSDIDADGFEQYMSDRMTEYEQLLVYFIYRHVSAASTPEDIRARIAFAILSYKLIYAMGAVMWSETGSFSFEDQAEIARMYSAEIEYSDQNLDILLDKLL